MSTAPLAEEHLAVLATVAETALGHALRVGRPWTPRPTDFDPALRTHRAAFVTVERERSLLGCIGSLAATKPVVVEVADRAHAAAFHDPRTAGVTPGDYAHATLTVSVLSDLEPLPAPSLDALAATLEPGRDGLVLALGGRRATFLPSVWPQLPDAERFVEALCRKAGVPHRPWPAGVRAFRYGVQHAVSAPPRAPITG